MDKETEYKDNIIRHNDEVRRRLRDVIIECNNMFHSIWEDCHTYYKIVDYCKSISVPRYEKDLMCTYGFIDGYERIVCKDKHFSYDVLKDTLYYRSYSFKNTIPIDILLEIECDMEIVKNFYETVKKRNELVINLVKGW